VEVIQSVAEIDPGEIQRISKDFEERSPQELVRWGIEHFRDGITLACSFGAEDVALVDMIAHIDRSVPIFYLDTDYLFKETFEVRDRIVEKYGVRVVGVKPLVTIEEQSAQHGRDLYGRQPDLCCKIRKVEPLRRHLGGFQAWVTGIRRDQAPTRANAGLVEWDKLFNLVKLNPLARFTSADVAPLTREHDYGLGIAVNQVCFLEFGLVMPRELSERSLRAHARALGEPDLYEQFCERFEP